MLDPEHLECEAGMNSGLRTRRAMTKQRGERPRTKTIWLQIASQIATLAALTTTAGGANDSVSKRDVDAKLHYCTSCHGVSGRGFRGFYPIPRLAGQQPDYLKNQLDAFSDRRRTNNIMFNVSHTLSPAMQTALATDFQELNPKPLGGAPKNMVPDGKKIFEEGIAAANIPACASCHGENAKGNGQIPRLAGQLDDYIVSKLTNWNKERGQNPNSPDASAIMEPIAHGLTESQIKAVAAYVSYLE
jgi:cytochrome c553